MPPARWKHITDLQTGDKIDVSFIDADGNSTYFLGQWAEHPAGTYWFEQHDDGQHVFFNITAAPLKWRKIDLTTDVVVCLPSDSALPFTRSPSLQATMPITSAMNGALMLPTSKWVTDTAACAAR